MTLALFKQKLADAKLGKADKKWFPKWVMRYASSTGTTVNRAMPVSRERVIAFSRILLTNKVPAWQRLQGVRAVESYRNLVIGLDAPSLEDIKETLSRLAEHEQETGTEQETTGNGTGNGDGSSFER